MYDCCRKQLDTLRERDSFDAVVDYGLHLSVSVVCELLDIPVGDRPMLTEWVRTIFYRPAHEAGLTDAGADAGTAREAPANSARSFPSREAIAAARSADRLRANGRSLSGASIDSSAMVGRSSDEKT